MGITVYKSNLLKLMNTIGAMSRLQGKIQNELVHLFVANNKMDPCYLIAQLSAELRVYVSLIFAELLSFCSESIREGLIAVSHLSGEY